MAFQAYNFTLDTATQLKDAGLVAADAAGTVSSAAAYVDLGAANAYAKFAVVIDWTACEVASGDEVYDLQVQGSTASSFSTKYILASKKLGDSSVTGQPVDTAASGRIVIFGDNVVHPHATDATQQLATQYIRVYADVGGTIATGINYTAWFIPLP